MRKMMFAFAVALTLPFAVFAQNADKAAKAQEVLKQARAAIGDESKLKALNSLSASASFRRTQGEREVSGEIELELLMPDKIKISNHMQIGPMDITQVQALNGTEVWTDFIGGPGGPGGGPGGGRGGMMNDPQMRERQQNEQRANLTRLALALLLAPPSSIPLEYSYAAEAQTPTGKADVIDVTGPNNFKARLVIDQATHRLFMLSYKGKQLRGFGGPGGGRGPGGQGGGQGGQGAQGGQNRPQMTPEEIEKLRKERQEAYDKAPEIEFQWVVSEYKQVNGLNLPHRILRGEASTPNEEWTINKYKINPSLKADKFVKKDKSQG